MSVHETTRTDSTALRRSGAAPTRFDALSSASRLVRWVLRLPVAGWRVARAHDLNPWVFVGMSLVGWLIHSMVYMPWFQSESFQLAFLILLRFVALVVPTYILLKGKGIARAFNGSIVAMFALNTAWHVCYYVYF